MLYKSETGSSRRNSSRRVRDWDMTPEQFKAIRQRAGLTQSGLAALLRISDDRAVRRWEAGERKVSGPVSVLMELLDARVIPLKSGAADGGGV